ncbi:MULTISPECIES: hypothetical protein [Stutzerimonas stutzeri subgroup]|uniref:hypothetical protein n=1 Tax=Stutzerimonas stutzeri subgroup TaxID=578833 RepID=UPI000254978E|nr:MULTISPECIES: hypothetical protein [Stutzerimonas stutzeri subgroup]MDH2240990.1 hypothetical protein [Pseudomonas sp. GD03909]MDH2244986.1 hypothetical protein [Pseudomonas sp. GD03856]MDH2263785.1 hypothetical protein [Pseudomonas sp. GD03855]EHY78378.1 hypothetical protein PstZobell_13171 [Stutzerimonas stutzeri ATCC 14405 = CCUG 16156]MBA1239204.1 hypothetical protein [Stutzerimonas kunmingensis]
MDAQSNRYSPYADNNGWRAAGVPGDPEEPGVPTQPTEPGEPTVPDQPPPAPVA